MALKLIKVEYLETTGGGDADSSRPHKVNANENGKNGANHITVSSRPLFAVQRCCPISSPPELMSGKRNAREADFSIQPCRECSLHLPAILESAESLVRSVRHPSSRLASED